MVDYRRPSVKSKDPLEALMATRMGNYFNAASSAYDPEFRALVESLTGKIQNGDTESRKAQILQWCRDHGHRPTYSKTNKAEYDLNRNMTCYISTSHKCYDPEFRAELDRVCPGHYGKHAEEKVHRKAKVLQWCQEQGRRPSRSNPQMDDELIIYKWMAGFTLPSNKQYDQEFTDMLNAMVPKSASGGPRR